MKVPFEKTALPTRGGPSKGARGLVAQLVSLFAALVLLPACSTTPPPKPDPEFVAVRPAVAVPPPPQNGAIYQAGYGMSLFSDPIAKHVGDVITILLQENTSARKSASTSTSKASEIDFPSPTLFGGLTTYRGQEILQASLDADRTFEGEGDSAQSNSLSGRITVTVAEVLPNGNLMVQGEKRLTLNEGSEHVRFSGIVRPQDIRSDNSVLSTQVADASIVYGGTGALADANRQGWLMRFFNSPLWPF